MACDMTKLANFSVEKQQLIATCVDNYTGDLCNFASANADTSAGSMDANIRERFEKEILHGEKYNYRTYRKYKNDIFEILEVTLDQTLPEGWRENEFFDRFVETIRVDLGDKNEFYAEDNGYMTVSKFSGNHWDTARERMDLGAEFSVDTSWWEVHFYNEFERFMKNIDSFSKMLDKARKSFLQAFQNAVYIAFADLGNTVPEGFTGHGALSSDTERDELLELIDKVSVANGGVKPILVGTGAALRKLQKNIDEDWIAPSAKEERKANGIISSWEGYDLMPIPQVFKQGTFEFALSTTRILILATNGKPIKFVFEGDSRLKDNTDNRANMDQTLEGQIQVKAGVAAVTSDIIGDWELA
jgi:hypothetical protein